MSLRLLISLRNSTQNHVHGLGLKFIFGRFLVDDQEVGYKVAGSYDHESYENI